ncbi:hypothetical protein Ancab_015084 [Ancistrocladus abbreviatus]
MYKSSKLWTQFYTLLRRDLQFIPSLCSYFSSEIQSFYTIPVPLSSTDLLQSRVCGTSPRQIHVKALRLYEKAFCSQSNEGRYRECWNCNSILQSKISLVCESCGSIQPVDHSVDYFQIFGLEKKFDIEEGSLEGKYKVWQKKLHPDLVHSKSERERRHAAEQSARVIDAYRTLGNPLSRAIYLMKLHGIHVDEEQTVSDPELLGEIMEIRESVEEAADSQELKQIQSQVQEKLRQWSNSFLSAFRSQRTKEALYSIQRMTYYKRVDEEIVKML